MKWSGNWNELVVLPGLFESFDQHGWVLGAEMAMKHPPLPWPGILRRLRNVLLDVVGVHDRPASLQDVGEPHPLRTRTCPLERSPVWLLAYQRMPQTGWIVHGWYPEPAAGVALWTQLNTSSCSWNNFELTTPTKMGLVTNQNVDGWPTKRDTHGPPTIFFAGQQTHAESFNHEAASRRAGDERLKR